MKTILTAITLLWIISSRTLLFAGCVVDISSHNTWGDVDQMGQSFTAECSGYLEYVDVLFSSLFSNNSVNIKVYQGDGLGGSLLTQTTFQCQDVANAYMRFNFPAPRIGITSGVMYTIIFDFVIYSQVYGVSDGTYETGSWYAYDYNSSSWIKADPLDLQCKIGISDNVPVEFTSFSSKFLNNCVELNWQTATETNNSGFEIERSLNLRGLGGDDGNSNLGGFVPIGFVNGHGTTTEPQSYSFTDKNIENGNYQYRIKQIDYDGSYEYSNIVEVAYNIQPSTFELFQNYPNPFNPTTTIKYSVARVETGHAPSLQHVTLEIYDVLGRQVAALVDENHHAGNYEREWNASNLSSGIYFCRMKAGSYKASIKLLLLK